MSKNNNGNIPGYNNNQLGQNPNSDMSNLSTLQQQRDYERLVNKSLEEQITDQQVSRADITNPNLHYGIEQKVEVIESEVVKKPETPAPKFVDYDKQSETQLTDRLENQIIYQQSDPITVETKPLSKVPAPTDGTETYRTPPLTANEATPPPLNEEEFEPQTLPRDTEAPQIVEETQTSSTEEAQTENVVFNPDLVTRGDSVNENSAAGTVIATLDLADADGTNYSYYISDANGNPVNNPNFTISENYIVVANGADLDFETSQAQSFYITGRDQGGNTVTEQFTVNINDVNEFDISAITDTDAGANTVAENSAFGTSVGITAFASDADGSNNGITYSLSNDAGGLFTINATTGEVTVAGNIDFETATSQTIEVTATSDDGSTSTQSYTINVTDTAEHLILSGEDDIFTDTSVKELSINAGGGYDTVTGTDGNDEIHGGTGFDTLYGNDGNDTIYGDEGKDTIYGGNGDDYLDGGAWDDTLDGGDGNDTLIGDGGKDTLIGGNGDDILDGGAWDDNLDGGDGNDTLIGGGGIDILAGGNGNDNLDGGEWDDTLTGGSGDDTLEGGTGNDIAVYSGNWSNYTITFDENTSTYTVQDNRPGSPDGTDTVKNVETFQFADGNVSVNDILNDAPTDITVEDGTIDENSVAGSLVATLDSIDLDSFIPSEVATLSLTNDPSGFFELVGNEIRVKSGADINFENASSHEITVEVTDVHGATYSEVITINVTDVDEFDVSAITDTNAGANTVAENSAVGTSVGITAFASDADGSNNGITYSLSNDAGGLFTINATTGEVTVAGNIDFETAASQTIEVTATSDDGSTSTQSYTINVTDVDEFDVSAITDTNAGANTVAENSAVGTSVGITAFASDADGSNNGITYSLSNDAGGLFTINATTGEVTVAGNIDFETATSQTIEVTATSDDGSTSTQSYTINVTDVDEFDVSAITDTDAGANTVAENSAVGTSVGITAFASDADGSNNGITYSLSNDAGGLFTINATTGEVTVAGNIDYETATSQTIEVTATSDDGSTSTQSYTINVTDQDEFDVSAISDTDAGANTVAENSAVGTSVGITAFASDADGSNNGITYSLSNDAGGLFTINATTGEVTVAGNIDYETATSQTIEVTATSDDGSTSTQSYTINVTDQDEFDVSAITDTDAGANTVAENSAVGSSVGITAFASDADGSKNGITYSLSNDAGGLFTINATTGEVTVAGNIDFETATSQTIEVTATSDDGSTSTQSYTINVTDVDEFDVSAISDTNASANTVAENSAVGTSVGITAFASDADGSNNGITYSLSNDAGGLFTINATTGEVTVAGNIDFETATSQTIEVTATSDDGSTSTQSYTINVTDQNEAGISGISDINNLVNAVDEDASAGTVVGITALATDPDASDSVTYSLTDNAGGLFTINANTGVVTVAGSLDAETATNHIIEVTATSSDGSITTERFSIGVNDVNETSISAISDTNNAANEISESAAVGTAVGITAFASDADITDTVTYSLSDNPGGFFAIDANTGVVTIANDLDYETATTQTIEVTATSDDGSTSTQSYTINVTDVDEFDVSAITDTNAGANTVAENSAVGTSVGITAFASDADGSNNGITYSLSDDAGGLFTINATTGEVTVAGNIDFETATSQTIEVTATSDDGSTSTQSYTINVTDVDEFDVSAITDTDAGANTVAENSAVGTSVGITAFASDADGSNNGITYSLSDDAGGLFTINATTGEVTVAGNIDYETATSQTIEVTATSDDGSTSTQSYTINVTDQDEFDVSAISDTNAGANTVAENSAVGSSVGITAFASDADGSNNGITYSLSNDAGGLFTINATTGEVTVAGNIDFETATSQTIEVTATSDDGSTSTQSYTINVTDVDEFDVSAITDTDAGANTVAENSAVGTSVGITAFASDADGSNNGITYSLSNDAGGLFTINATTGEVTVAGNIDFETATSQTIEVTATSDDGSTSTQSYAINVTDQDEFDVSAITDTDAGANTVAENSAVGTSVGITAFASDADGTNNGITYSLSNDAGGLFTINATTGEVTVAGNINFETATTQTIEVTATSDDGSTSTQSYTINVTDVDEFDVSAISDTDAGANTVAENSAVGTSVGITAFASDADGTNNGITYSLSNDAGGLFTINATTGEVTVAGNINFETATTQTIEVTATSDDGSTSTQSYTINVTDVDEFDVSAISDTDAGANTVAENSAVGTSVGITAFASDADGSNNGITYSLSDDAGGLFTINATTGEVTVAGNIDFETATTQTIEVTATSDDGSTSTQSYTINVTDQDEFDVSAITDTNASANTVAENSAVGTSVGITAFASDADGSNNGITYSLSNDAGGLFTINATTGEVTVVGNIDYETAASQTIEVTATSDDGSTSTQSYNIAISNVNEAPDAQNVDLGATNEDTGILITQAQLLANSSDVDAGTILQVTSLSLQINDTGTLIDNGNGTWTFNPADDYAANDVQFDFTISDGSITDSAVANIDINAIADAPTLIISTTSQDIISNTSVISSGFEGDVTSIGATGNDGFVGSIGGWQTDSDAIEVKSETLGDGSTNQYIELNTDNIDFYEDASNIYQLIETTNGGTYTVDFSYAPRPGYDASVNTIEVLIDGVVVDTISADGSTDISNNWQTSSITFTGDGTPARVEFREAGADVNYGRGMLLDNITIEEVMPEGFTSGMENTTITLPDITASTNDSDGSETLAITITNIPEGATITDGINSFTATSGNTEVDVTNWQNNNLTMDPPSEFSGEIILTVIATATDGTNQNTTSSNITVIVTDDDDTFIGTATEDVYDAGAGNDILNGNGGNDWLYGGAGDDTINGGNGDDMLTGGAGDDIIDGGIGADTAKFSGNLADYSIAISPEGEYLITDLRTNSPDGADLITNVESFQFADQTIAVGDITPTTAFDLGEFRTVEGGITQVMDFSTETTGQTITGTDGNELILGGSGDDIIDAGAGNDNANGQTGKDTIYGGSGDDILLGGTGKDTISGDTGNDTIDGGEGNDTALYTGNLADYTIITQDDGSFRIIDNRLDSPDGTDVVTNVEFFQFADGIYTNSDLSSSDLDAAANSVEENSAIGTTVGITASSPGDVTYSLTDDAGGLFTVDSKTGVVTVAGNIDYETSTTHTIEVTATQSDGTALARTYEINVTNTMDENPTDISVTGNQELLVTNGILQAGSIIGDVTSVIDADIGDTHTFTLSDNAEGRITIDANSGLISNIYDHDPNVVYNDTITVKTTDSGGQTYSEVIGLAAGTESADFITGSVNDDLIYGFDGNDTISGGAGDDFILAGSTTDSSIGATNTVGSNYSLIYLGTAADVDTIEFLSSSSENAADLLGTYGNYDNPLYNQIVSATANDTNGNNRLDDNDNSNFFPEKMTIGGTDKSIDSTQVYNATVTFTDGSTGTFTGVVSQYTDGTVYLNPEFESNADSILLTSKPIASISLDSISTNDTDLTATRLDMDYALPGDSDIIDGGEGNDTIYSGTGQDIIDGGSGDDVIYYGTGGDTVYGGDGNDIIDDEIYTIHNYNDTIDGGAGNDTIWSGGGEDIIKGGTGDDWIDAESGNDIIDGGSGTDEIYAGDGNDTVIGGLGNDTLHGGDGDDLFIYQIGDGNDQIYGGTGASWTDTIMLQDAIGGDTLGTYGSDWTVTLTEGTIDVANPDSLILSNDADGMINLSDGSSINFADIERIDW